MRFCFSFRTSAIVGVAALLAGSLLSPHPCSAGDSAPATFDSGAELLPLDRVAVMAMGPVDVDALRAEDATHKQNKRLLAAWLASGGPMPAALQLELSQPNRERYGSWLAAGGPIPAEVLESLDADRAAALAGLALDEGTPVPAALAEALPELNRVFEKKERVGLPMPAWQAGQNVSPANSGTWEDPPGGSRIWRLRVRSEGARWLVLGFRTFRPAPGARLHIYAPECAGDPGCDKLLGPFTAKDIREHRQLWTPPIEGDELVLELSWPRGLAAVRPDIVLGTVSHGYKGPWPEDEEAWTASADECKKDKGLGDSGWCNVDVVCEPDWSKEKRGVVHLLLYGSSWCSASLINTTDLDCKPYVLTARHCISNASEAAGTSFRFKYERANCGSGAAPTNNLLTGSALRASRSTTDFSLLEMNLDPPATWDAYFNGWSRVDDPTQVPGATCIHHPSGDAKKISFEFDGIAYGTLYGSDHWKVPDWDPTAHGEGTTEGGSSGSPLFDHTDPVGATPHIIGQLHGGYAACGNNSFDEYGRLDLSWTGGGSASSRLSDWLAPGMGDAAPMSLGGLDHLICLNPLPELSYEEYFLEDLVGNQNGFPEPSEEIDLAISIHNSGTTNATGLEGVLSTTAPGVTITQDTATWRTIVPGDTQTSQDPPYHLVIDGNFACEIAGTSIPLRLNVSFDQSTSTERMSFQLPIGVPLPDEVFNDDLEPEPEDGWLHIAGGRSWTLLDSADPDDYTSPTHSWSIENGETPQQAWLRLPLMPPDDPQIPGVDTLPANARLRFQHRFLTENNIDGGVLEFSVDSGVTWHDITHDLGGGDPIDRFIANGYNGHILAMGDRAAWEGDSGGWQQVEVDLADFEGQWLQLRFLFATNEGNIATVDGWYIDDVVVDYIKYTCPILGPPGEVTGLVLGKPAPDKVSLSFDPPASGAGVGGPVEMFTVQTVSLPGPLDLQFHLNLGGLTSVDLNEEQLPDGQGCLIVGENPQGTGPAGYDSEGNPRPPAEPAP